MSRMTKYKGIAFIAVLVLVLAVAAVAQDDAGHEDAPESPEESEEIEDVPDEEIEPGVALDNINQDMLDDLADQYNQEYAHRMPRIIALLIGDERVNVHLELEDGSEEVYGIALDGMEVAEATVGGVDQATISLYTSVETVEEIAVAENPRERATEAYSSDEIRYETVGTLRSLKMRVVSFAVSLFG